MGKDGVYVQSPYLWRLAERRLKGGRRNAVNPEKNMVFSGPAVSLVDTAPFLR